jgi:hypothetical protein
MSPGRSQHPSDPPLRNAGEPDFDPVGGRVVVAGGGPSGIVAALAAARQGADTLLLEQNGFVGGVAGTGPGLQGFYDNVPRRIIGGIPWELVEQMMRTGICAVMRNDGDRADPFYLSRLIRFNPELFKQVATERLLEAGVRFLPRSLVTGVTRDGSRITGVVVENKSGRVEIPAGCVVDCTGDGDVAARAGATYELGAAGDGDALQPMTMLFFLSRVDVDRAVAAGVLTRQPWNVHEPARLRDRIRSFRLDLRPWTKRIAEAIPDIHEITGTNFHDYGNGIFHTGNFIHVSHLNGADGEQLARAEVLGRRVVWRLVDFLRGHVPGFEDVNLVQTATSIGVRETRRIHGLYRVSVDDARQARQFPDNIAQSGNLMDIHDSHKADYLDVKGGTQIAGGRSFGLPYRALVPRAVDGLLVAGRCASGSREAQSSFRVMGTCMAMGEAAGTAAAMAARGHLKPRDLDPTTLRQRLVSNGAIVDSDGSIPCE